MSICREVVMDSHFELLLWWSGSYHWYKNNISLTDSSSCIGTFKPFFQAGNVRVFSYELQIGADMGGNIIVFNCTLNRNWIFFFRQLCIGTLSNFLVIIPMIISSALVVVVAVKNRFPKLLIPWIVFSILELFIVLFGCYLFMVAAGQAFQPKSIEKFFFITIGVLLLTGNVMRNQRN
jgi:hypothetical protein